MFILSSMMQFTSGKDNYNKITLYILRVNINKLNMLNMLFGYYWAIKLRYSNNKDVFMLGFFFEKLKPTFKTVFIPIYVYFAKL